MSEDNTKNDKGDKEKLNHIKDQECNNIENPEMARNYEEEQPCNDGTINH